MSANSIRRQILLPLTLTLLMLLATFLFSIYQIKLQEVDEALDQHYEAVQVLSRELRGERIRQLSMAAELIARDPHLQAAMVEGRRDLLLEYSEPLFAEVLQPLGISHLYFHQSDRHNFLRVHKPEFFGDFITRQTLREVAARQALTAGLELGPLGTFTLRVVLPWDAAGDLIGYIETGEDVDLFLARLRERVGIEYLVALEKRFLDRERWEDYMAQRGLAADWDNFPEHVLLDGSLPQTPAGFAEALAIDHQRHLDLPFEMEVAGRTLRGRLLPLTDVSGTDVGDVLVMLDVTEKLALFNRSMLVGGGLTLVLGGVLFAFSWVMLGRAARQLAEVQGRLVDEFELTRQANDHLEHEMAERRRVEESLREARDELEKRVAQRTAELRNALRDAQESGERIDAILRSVADGLLVVDDGGRVLLINERAREMFGLGERAEGGQRIEALFAGSALLPSLRQALADNQTEGVFDFEHFDSQGARRIIQSRISAIRRPENGHSGVLVLMEDVTQARMIDRMKSEFISTVAHEFRTPLATVLGFSELLLSRDDFTPEQRREFLTYIFEKADALAAIVDDLLDLSRIEAGRELELNEDACAPESVFLPVIRDYRLNHPAFVFDLDLQPAALGLFVDRRKGAQIMENLLSNAVKYSSAQRRVAVSGRVSGDFYEVQVRDWGIGMSPEQSARVFEKFYRADSSNIAIAGTGLGMSIVKHIVEAHGGRVWIESALGEGTTVFFTLPLAQEGQLSSASAS
ncbi:ATP-binding protein [Geoalkalibacter sp.]|uniref:ATP-binding protein n=1 Tax=Geoalkalibacter sp. TaxID=3041440 RepID=UPI00272E9AC0|nr:ATP-binding protein [Geoalkalibacter sp.]